MRFLTALCIALFAALPLRADVDIVEVTSPGGIKAWLVEDHSIPFTALELRFRGGASLDAPDKRGAVNMMTALLEEGAGDLDARGFARSLEALAASFRYRAATDDIAISARLLTENRDAGVDLLRASLHEPRFDPDAIERIRAQILTGLRSDEKDPNTLASQAFDAMAYGGHPYATSMYGTVASVSSLTRDDLFAAHEAVFARDRLYVGAVGDITPEALGVMLDEFLADLPAEGAPMPPVAEVTIDGGITVVPFDTPQSVAIFGHAGIAQEDPDFFAASVLNQVLGGGSFESRLMQEVREKRGLTYGVYSYLAPRHHAAVYLGQVASANERIAETISVIRAEWGKAAREGVSAKEVADAKTYMTGAYPLRFDGNEPIARIMVGMQMLGLPIDYIPTRNDRVEAVTLDDVNRVAAELLDPEALHFVVVGQPEGLETGPLPTLK